MYSAIQPTINVKWNDYHSCLYEAELKLLLEIFPFKAKSVLLFQTAVFHRLIAEGGLNPSGLAKCM